MSHKFDECVEAGHHTPIINDSQSTEDDIEGFLECRICGAITENFSLDWLVIDNNYVNNLRTISGILAEEEMKDRMDRDNNRIRGGLK